MSILVHLKAMKQFAICFLLLLGLLGGCSEHNDEFPGLPESIPQAITLVYSPSPVTAGSTLTGSYTFVESLGLGDASTYSWLADGVVINGATSTTLDLSQPLTDENGSAINVTTATFAFCVLPINSIGTIGQQVCVTPPSVSPIPAVTVGTDNTTPPAEGETLTGAYTYVPGMDVSPESGSTGVWKVGGTNTGTTCSPSNGCTYTVQPADIGQTVEFCVTPTSASGMNGPEVCSTIFNAYNLTITGSLEYRQTLTGTITGGPTFTASYWKVDVDDTTGPVADDNPIKMDNNVHGIITGENTVTSTFQIGTLATITPGPPNDTNSTFLIDDHDWYSGSFSQPALDANQFIGKNIAFCANTAVHGEQCVWASDIQNADGSACTDSNICVTSGIYYDFPDLTKRGIAPIESISATEPPSSSTRLIRPYTTDEIDFARAGTLSYGTGLPIPDGTVVINGIEYALYNHGDPTASRKPVVFCSELIARGESDWSLSVASNTNLVDGYTTAASGGTNNNTAPIISGQNIGFYSRAVMRRDPPAAFDLSAIMGWPLTIPYWNARFDSGNIHATDMSASTDGETVANATDQNLVSCIRLN